MAHTSIPRGFTSMCKQAANCETNALVLAYMAANGVGMNPATLDVNTIQPRFFCVTNFWTK